MRNIRNFLDYRNGLLIFNRLTRETVRRKSPPPKETNKNQKLAFCVPMKTSSQ